EDACLTFSVGMRAPSAAELLGDYVDTLAAEADEALRYRDPDLAPAADPHEMGDAAMARVLEALSRVRMDGGDRLSAWFGGFITRYRSPGEVAPGPVPPRIELEYQFEHAGIALHRHPLSRMAWRRMRKGARLFANGEGFSLPVADARRIAGAATVDGALYAAPAPAGRGARCAARGARRRVRARTGRAGGAGARCARPRLRARAGAHAVRRRDRHRAAGPARRRAPGADRAHGGAAGVARPRRRRDVVAGAAGRGARPRLGAADAACAGARDRVLSTPGLRRGRAALHGSRDRTPGHAAGARGRS